MKVIIDGGTADRVAFNDVMSPRFRDGVLKHPGTFFNTGNSILGILHKPVNMTKILTWDQTTPPTSLGLLKENMSAQDIAASVS